MGASPPHQAFSTMEQQDNTARTAGKPLFRFIRFWYERLSLSADKDDEQEIIDSISRNVTFKGVNLWTLVFAIFIASIGLNVNSTAVVIGAMLISPLMGPIVGIGLGLGINDFELIRKAGFNLGIAVMASVITSALYFWITPLSDDSSELLARTSPTIWDVLIAFFGGLAGMVAAGSKGKGNAIPGVAIATALMPPLCTAGYGLAKMNPTYFFGAFYLFFINSVMISLSTLLIVRLLKLPKKSFVDARKSSVLRRTVGIIVVLTVAPSIYLGYRIVREAIFNRGVQQFMRYEMTWENTQIITERHQYVYGDTSTIEVLLTGASVEEQEIEAITRKLPQYGLDRTRLIVWQGAQQQFVDVDRIKNEVIQDLYRQNAQILKDQEGKIRFLEEQLTAQQKQRVPVEEITRELSAIYPNVQRLHLGRVYAHSAVDSLRDTIGVAVIRVKGQLSSKDQQRMAAWLQERTHLPRMKIVLDK